MIDCVNIGFDVFGPLYGLAVQSYKVGIFERIVSYGLTGWPISRVNRPAKKMAHYVGMNIFFALSQDALTASFVDVKLAIRHPSAITMGFNKPVLLD